MRMRDDLMQRTALAVLDEAAHACHDAPIKPTIGLRFALSYLYAMSDKAERQHFSDFLIAIQDDVSRISREGERSYIRSTRAQTCLKGIMLAVGYPSTPEAQAALYEAWSK